MGLSPPTELRMADGLRDGGSYYVLYRAADGNLYSINLPVHLAQMVATGYGAPRVACEPINLSRELSWPEARSLGAAIASLGTGSLVEGTPERLSEFLLLLGREGALS
jgi:hypothetical protein